MWTYFIAFDSFSSGSRTEQLEQLNAESVSLPLTDLYAVNAIFARSPCRILSGVKYLLFIIDPSKCSVHVYGNVRQVIFLYKC